MHYYNRLLILILQTYLYLRDYKYCNTDQIKDYYLLSFPNNCIGDGSVTCLILRIILRNYYLLLYIEAIKKVVHQQRFCSEQKNHLK